jgi:hypothetical protein
MYIFHNDDKPYLHWVTHHRQGYVLDGRRKPRFGRLRLHRATCSEIRTAASKRTHWTTGGRFKACSLGREELERWANEESAKAPDFCTACRSNQVLPAEINGQPHLTKLGSDILDYVLDAALIHLDEVTLPYRLTVADIPACMGKTPGQISPVLHRLIADGVLAVQGKYAAYSAIPPRRIILPTVKGVKTLSTFADESDEIIAAALDMLLPN